MNLQIVANLTSITVSAEPSWKDNFKNILFQNSNLPAVFFQGKDWSIEHQCSNCRKELVVSIHNNTARILGYLSNYDFNSKEFITKVGECLNLSKTDYIDENNKWIYNFKLSAPYSRVANLLFYSCPNCMFKYLSAFSFIAGDDDRQPEPDRIYIEKIVMVEFDEKEFFQELNKQTS